MPRARPISVLLNMATPPDCMHHPPRRSLPAMVVTLGALMEPYGLQVARAPAAPGHAALATPVAGWIFRDKAMSPPPSACRKMLVRVPACSS